ncbi:uncharacterized protein (TIGR02270 family) [Loktanella ponticola]|uniref:Uncharacterized protein (TIGR02270 family) n=1 Tax=Yoonia ponticola TaxID=1524255 RepID=A0A7W9BMG2_9RHOB|nr:TIGR02270 family protein [Yoonia ponticola]MBB5723237.1 uncharacterized protein (TIGR02270 family) [Yoonia ponticola]
MTHIPIILTQHAEDAAVLWERRRRAVDAPHYNTMYLARLDEQLEAHLDGLRIAGAAGWEEAVAAFKEIGGGGEMFTLSTLAFGQDDPALIQSVIELIKADPNAFLGPAASGIGWLHQSKLSGKVSPLLLSDDLIARALGVGGCALHRVDPGKQLTVFLDDPPGVKRRAVRLAGEIGRVGLLPCIQELCHDTDAETAYWATWSAVLLGDRGEALDQLLQIATGDSAKAQDALGVALPAMGFEAGCNWLNAQPVEATTTKITGYGILGDAGAVPWLIEQMADDDLAQIAGESYALITGADLEKDDLDRDIPDGALDGPNDDPTDDDVDLGANENLAWASADHVASHWRGIRARFGSGSYILGRPAGVDTWRDCFANGYQRQRRVAATWLAVSEPAAPLGNWKVPVFRSWPR